MSGISEGWYICGWVLLFTLGVVGFGIWRIKRRKERTPMQFKLLRSPGESLRKRLKSADENDWLFFVLTALAPLGGASGFVAVGARILPKPYHLHLLIAAGVVFIALTIISARLLLRRLHRYRSDWLGYMGERAVGEALVDLYARSFRIYHDVPAQGGKKPFNLDHVVVGPSGLWLIETKTRRKGRARPGLKDHEVTFDGAKLIWPWGEDTHGVQQAQSEARWLSDWVSSTTGLSVTAKPILALPGWYVRETALGAVRVLNHKNLCSAISGRGHPVLSPEHIDLISRQLDQRCRDVED
jgi:Nuclease-related domain